MEPEICEGCGDGRACERYAEAYPKKSTSMTFEEYTRLAARTDVTKARGARLLNSILGLNGEAGEIAELYKKLIYHNKPVTYDDLIDELGDVLWYVASFARACEVELSEVARRNIAKLEARYKSGQNKQTTQSVDTPVPGDGPRGCRAGSQRPLNLIDELWNR